MNLTIEELAVLIEERVLETLLKLLTPKDIPSTKSHLPDPAEQPSNREPLQGIVKVSGLVGCKNGEARVTFNIGVVHDVAALWLIDQLKDRFTEASPSEIAALLNAINHLHLMGSDDQLDFERA